MITLMLLACANKTPSAPRSPPAHDSEEVATDTSSMTSDTDHPDEDTSAIDTGTISWESLTPLEPDSVIVGETSGYGRKVWYLGDVSGDGHGDLACSRAGDTAVFLGPIASGSVSLWDDAHAVFPFSIDQASLHRAGDTDGDGTEDLWLGPALFRGPFDGVRELSEHQASVRGPQGVQPLGGFDADGDGHLDVALANEWLEFEVQYGPFDGIRYGALHPDADFSQITQFLVADRDCMLPDSKYVGPFNRPDEKLLVVQGVDDVNCHPIGHFVDLSGPRGRQMSPDDAVASSHNRVFGVLPDTDGDGLNDVIWAGAILSGTSASYLQYDGNGLFQDVNQMVPLPDVTGDGLGDLLAERRGDADLGRPRQYFVVPGTTRGLNLKVGAVGMFLTEWETEVLNFTAGDLDGDGLAELIGFGGYGEVRIWRGAEVQAAMVDAGLATP